MSTHPNAILLVTLTPEDGARKTFRAICAETDSAIDDGSASIKIAERLFHAMVMEDDYDENYQIGAKEGDIVLFDMVTYDYGDTIEWDKLAAQKTALEQWAVGICERHKCTSKFFVTANYW